MGYNFIAFHFVIRATMAGNIVVVVGYRYWHVLMWCRLLDGRDSLGNMLESINSVNNIYFSNYMVFQFFSNSIDLVKCVRYAYHGKIMLAKC